MKLQDYGGTLMWLVLVRLDSPSRASHGSVRGSRNPNDSDDARRSSPLSRRVASRVASSGRLEAQFIRQTRPFELLPLRLCPLPNLVRGVQLLPRPVHLLQQGRPRHVRARANVYSLNGARADPKRADRIM